MINKYCCCSVKLWVCTNSFHSSSSSPTMMIQTLKGNKYFKKSSWWRNKNYQIIYDMIYDIVYDMIYDMIYQRRARWILRGRDKNQESRTFKSWFKQESRIYKSSRISAVKNQEYFSNFLDFKQESRKGKSKFLISSGSRDLNFGKRQQIQARIKIFQKNTLSLNLKTYIFSN